MDDSKATNGSPRTSGSPRGLDPSRRGELPWLDDIMRRLLEPDGCPWDREQTLATLRPYLIEECYELLDALDSGDRAAHCEELGDVLLQVVFQARLAQIPLRDVICAIGDKLLRRHPHVFGSVEVADAEEVLVNWDRIKAEEKGGARKSALDGLPRSLPALHRAHELTRKAARAGFRWRELAGARDKVAEELGEADEAAAAGDELALRHELGDLLFAVAAWAREQGVQPEDALRQANERFEGRFRALEADVTGEGRRLEDCPEAELLARWRAATR